MSDMGELYRDWDAAKKGAKADRLEIAEARKAELRALAPIRTRTPYHWTITLCNAPGIEFWPSTGRWMHKKRRYNGTFDDLLGFVKNRSADDE